MTTELQTDQALEAVKASLRQRLAGGQAPFHVANAGNAE